MEHQKKINEIVFGGVHPNRVVAEGFLEHLRAQGHHDTPLRTHTVASKLPISFGHQPEADRPTPQNAPVHFKETYEKLPKELGMKPATYGSGASEISGSMQGAPIQEGKVRKSEDPQEQQDHASEVQTLLRNPDPAERTLALKLDSVSPQDLAVAILDPDPMVWMTAFQHPLAAWALDVLAASTRDNKGAPIWDRHDSLLADPRCSPQHREAIRNAVQNDSFLPVHIAAERLALVALHKSQNEEIVPEYLHDEVRKFTSAPREWTSSLRGDKQFSAPYLKQPYATEQERIRGWAQITAEALYNASGIRTAAPVFCFGNDVITVVPHCVPLQTAVVTTDPGTLDKLRAEARKVAVIDSLLGIRRPSGDLLVSSGALAPINNHKIFGAILSPQEAIQPILDPEPDLSETMEWLHLNEQHLRVEFDRRLQLIPRIDQIRLRPQFVAAMDRLTNPPTDAETSGLLTKALGSADFVHHTDNTENPHKAVSDRTPHLRAPAALHPDIKHFETHLNGPTVHEPVMGNLGGIEPKAVYRHGDKHFIVKGAGNHKEIDPTIGSTAPMAWSEMVSQDTYHAAGIGHLHQKVHITSHQGKSALVIHMHPGLQTSEQSYKIGDERSERIFDEQNQNALGKIGLMDYVLGNPDRHSGNLGITPEGQPLAIDNGMAMTMDHAYASGHPFFDDLDENTGDINRSTHDSEVRKLGAKWHQDPEIGKFWHQNKDKIKKTVYNHLDALNDPNYASKMKEAFENRIQGLDDRESFPFS